jgi:HAMP domain-containing protein
MSALAKSLRKRAELRRLEGWELSDVMTPDELDQVADEIERLAGALEEIRQNSVWAPRVNEIARRALSGEPR